MRHIPNVSIMLGSLDSIELLSAQCLAPDWEKDLNLLMRPSNIQYTVGGQKAEYLLKFFVMEALPPLSNKKTKQKTENRKPHMKKCFYLLLVKFLITSICQKKI